MHTKITEADVDDALNTEIVIASFSGEPGRVSRRKLVYDVTTEYFELWIGEKLVGRDKNKLWAIRDYNEFDAATVDYTPENLAHAGI